MKKIADKSEPFTLRVDSEWLQRVDVLINRMTRPGYVPTQTVIIRMAIAIGLDALQKEQPAVPYAPPRGVPGLRVAEETRTNPRRPPSRPARKDRRKL